MNNNAMLCSLEGSRLRFISGARKESDNKCGVFRLMSPFGDTREHIRIYVPHSYFIILLKIGLNYR